MVLTGIFVGVVLTLFVQKVLKDRAAKAALKAGSVGSEGPATKDSK